MRLYEAIAIATDAEKRCAASGNEEWQDRWNARLDAIEYELPSGSGFDNGTTIDRDRTDANRIVLITSFHHMDENGGYDGWTEHTVTIRPSFISRFTITVSGRNRNEIKDYIAEVIGDCLDYETEWSNLDAA